MRLLVDTNVLLDVLLAREPWAEEAALLLSAIEEGRAEGFVASHTVTTMHYLVARERGRQIAATAVTDLLRISRVVPVGAADFQQALVLDLADFEDAVQAAAALQVGADHVVTRNAKDYRGAPISARAPGEILALLETAESR